MMDDEGVFMVVLYVQFIVGAAGFLAVVVAPWVAFAGVGIQALLTMGWLLEERRKPK